MTLAEGEFSMKNLMVVLIGVMVFASCQMPMGTDTSGDSNNKSTSSTEETAVVEDVAIEYDGSTVYDRSVDLPVTVTWSDGVEESDVVTVEAPSTGAGEVTETYTVDGVSDEVTVVFEDWRLVGEWDNSTGNNIVFDSNGLYSFNGSNFNYNWSTEDGYLILDDPNMGSYEYNFDSAPDLELAGGFYEEQ